MTNTRKQYRIVNTKKGVMKLDNTKLQPVLADNQDELGGDIDLNSVDDYRSDFETTDLYIYSGYLLNLTPEIIREKDGIKETAENVTNLEADWDNRLTLTYT